MRAYPSPLFISIYHKAIALSMVIYAKIRIASAYKKKAAEQQALIMRDNPPQLNAQDVDADATFTDPIYHKTKAVSIVI